jgi:Domain of unknown function (DUF4382)
MNLCKLVKWIFILLLFFFFSACSGDETNSTSTGELSLLLTDASTEDYKAVYVTIKEVRVHPGTETEEENGSWEVVAEPGETFNLLELVNGAIEELGIRDLGEGHYTQLRMILDNTSDDGTNLKGENHPFANYIITQSDSYEELKVPSGFQSGIKIVHGFDIAENQLTELILDFDISKSVVKAGNSGKWILKPTIKVIDTLVAASVSGIISDIDANAVQNATVRAQAHDPSAENINDQIISLSQTISEEDGYYFMYLRPGTYKIIVYKNGYLTACNNIEVESKTFYEENFTIETTDNGTISGEVTISDATEDQIAVLRFRTNTTCNGGTEEVPIEVVSESITDSGTYSVTLPPGTYTIFASTEGKAYKAYDNIDVTSSTVTNQDISL